MSAVENSGGESPGSESSDLNLARALDAEPAIEEKIETLFWMGGSLDGHGNVVDPCFDGTAEWNAFWDPEAVKRVWPNPPVRDDDDEAPPA